MKKNNDNDKLELFLKSNYPKTPQAPRNELSNIILNISKKEESSFSIFKAVNNLVSLIQQNLVATGSVLATTLIVLLATQNYISQHNGQLVTISESEMTKLLQVEDGLAGRSIASDWLKSAEKI